MSEAVVACKSIDVTRSEHTAAQETPIQPPARKAARDEETARRFGRLGYDG